MDAIKKLSATKLVDLDQEDGFGLKVTEFGRVMARYYVKHKTMETILEMGAPTTLGEVVRIIAFIYLFEGAFLAQRCGQRRRVCRAPVPARQQA